MHRCFFGKRTNQQSAVHTANFADEQQQGKGRNQFFKDVRYARKGI